LQDPGRWKLRSYPYSAGCAKAIEEVKKEVSVSEYSGAKKKKKGVEGHLSGKSRHRWKTLLGAALHEFRTLNGGKKKKIGLEKV